MFYFFIYDFLGLYLFWLIETIARQCLSNDKTNKFNGHGHSHEAYNLEGSIKVSLKIFFFKINFKTIKTDLF